MTARFGIFLDSNVLISALIGDPDSPPVILTDWLAGKGLGPLLTGKCNVEEVERNLARKLPGALAVWKAFLRSSGIMVVPCKRRRMKEINAKDVPVVAAAVAAEATHFVTGDKRLMEEMKRAGVNPPLPVTPKAMLDIILALHAETRD